ncbi:DUF823 domain-containing adhesin, partial [Yersinia proxima]
DASNNDVTGAAAALTTNAVKVANATLKSSNWTDNNDGTYRATYLAQTSGTGLKATLTLDGWGQPATSAAYVITAGAPDGTQSLFSINPKEIISDGTAVAMLTFTAKDKNGNPVSSLNNALSFAITNNAGTTPDTGKVTIGAIMEEDDGVYTASLRGILADTYTLVPKLNGAAVGTLSDSVKLLDRVIRVSAEMNTSSAKVGDSIQMKVKAIYEDNQLPVSGLPFSINVKTVQDRQGKTRPKTISISGQTITDVNGVSLITISDINGIGTKTAFDIVPEKGNTLSEFVIFAVKTSPDTDKANMYGYMSDAITLSTGNTLKRPSLANELNSANTVSSNNETWSVGDFSWANSVCENNKLPSYNDMKSIYASYGNMKLSQGWPVDVRYWSNHILSTPGHVGSWSLEKGNEASEVEGTYLLAACIN